MLERFKRTGLRLVRLDPVRWERAPIRREALAVRFRSLPDEELLVQGFHAVLIRE